MNHQEFVGKKVIGRWGAMHPEWVGQVVAAGKIGVTIVWNEPHVQPQSAKYSELRNDYAAPVGSPVGVYVHVEEYI